MKSIFSALLWLVAFAPAFAQLAHVQALPVVSNKIKSLNCCKLLW